MNRKWIVSIVAMLAMLVALTGCKTNGMALTSRGQFLKINIDHPKDLPESGEDNLDVTISNRGVNNIQDVLADVELPPQLTVLDQTADRGVNVMHDPGSSVYHFTMSKLQPGDTSHIRFHVRTSFGTYRETGSVKVTAWQRDLPNDRLVETAFIKLRS